MINFQVDTRELNKLATTVATLQNRLPQTIAKSMTYAAYDAQKKLKAETPRFVDRPTTWTRNSTFVEKATPINLSVRLGFKDYASKGTPAARYLQPMVAGEPRPLKRFERQLQSTGVLRSYEFTTPTGIRPLALNQYGNIPASSLVRLLSRVRGFSQQGYTANRSSSARSTAKRRQQDFFVGQPNGYARAIYARVGAKQRGFVPVLNITRQPNYRASFPVSSIVQAEFSRRFPSIFERIVFAAK